MKIEQREGREASTVFVFSEDEIRELLRQPLWMVWSRLRVALDVAREIKPEASSMLDY